MIPEAAVISNFLQWTMWVLTLNLLLPRRYSRTVTIAAELLGFVLYYFLTVVLNSSSLVVRFFLGTGCIVFFFSFFHRGRWYIRISLIVSLVLIAMIADIITYYATLRGYTPAESARWFAFSIAQYSVNLLINTVLLSLLAMAGWSLRRNYTWELSVPQMILFALFPACQLALLFRWFQTLWYGRDDVTVTRILVIFFLVFAADVALIFLIRSTAENASLSAAVKCREEERQSLQRYSASLLEERKRAETIEKEIADMWRDMKKTVLSGDAGKLADRAEAIGRTYLSTADLPECGNRVLAGFLARRKELMEDKGIRTEFSAAIPLRVGIPDPDLICAFGNLLDNAEEACVASGDPFVRLLADVQAPYMRIRVENSCSAQPVKKERRTPDLERGLGFQILRHMAEKYDGDFQYVSRGSTHIASIMIKGDI